MQQYDAHLQAAANAESQQLLDDIANLRIRSNDVTRQRDESLARHADLIDGAKTQRENYRKEQNAGPSAPHSLWREKSLWDNLVTNRTCQIELIEYYERILAAEKKCNKQLVRTIRYNICRISNKQRVVTTRFMLADVGLLDTLIPHGTRQVNLPSCTVC